jgi:hypothetical protein
MILRQNRQHERTTADNTHGQMLVPVALIDGFMGAKDVCRKRSDPKAQVCTMHARLLELSLFQPNQWPPLSNLIVFLRFQMLCLGGVSDRFSNVTRVSRWQVSMNASSCELATMQCSTTEKATVVAGQTHAHANSQSWQTCWDKKQRSQIS